MSKKLDFAIWRKVFLNFVGASQLTRVDRAIFFYWTPMDKLEFTDWSEVQHMFSSGEIAIYLQRMIIMPPTPGITKLSKEP